MADWWVFSFGLCALAQNLHAAAARRMRRSGCVPREPSSTATNARSLLAGRFQLRSGGIGREAPSRSIAAAKGLHSGKPCHAARTAEETR